jgi:hypothetical protein
LLDYALALAMVVGLWRVVAPRIGLRGAAPAGPLSVMLIAPCLWLIATIFVIERFAPQTFWVGNDWGSHLKWGGMFVTGVLLAERRDYWAWTQEHRVTLALVALVSLSLQSLNRAYWLTNLADPFWGTFGWSVTSGVYAWTMIGALVGYARCYLDRGSQTLTHLNEAILPVYVLHQPILLVAAYFLFPRRLPLMAEMACLAAITLLGSFVIYEVAIRPFGMMRVLFGLKPKPERTVRAAVVYSPTESPTNTARGAS